MLVLGEEVDRGRGGGRVEGEMQAAGARAGAFAVGGVFDVVVEEGKLGFVGVGYEACVVLPGEGEGRGCGGWGRGGLEEVVVLAAEGPEDVTGGAGDEIDGVRVADGDEVVTCFSL